MNYENLALQLLEGLPAFGKQKQRNIGNELLGRKIVLIFIAHKQSVLPKQIAEAFCISSARVASLLNNFEKNNFVKRQVDKNDRRQVEVKITKQGKVAAAKKKQEIVKNISEFLKELGEHDAKEYVRIMKKLSNINKSSIL